MQRQYNIKRIAKISAVALSAAVVIGCGGGANGTNSSNNTTNDIIGNGTVYLDQLGVVPVRSGYKSTYLLRINNGTSSSYTIESVKVTDITGSKDQSDIVKLVASIGKEIPANGSSIQFSPQLAISGDVLLTVTLKAADGKSEVLHQLIRMSDQVGSSAGIGAINDIGQINSKDGSYSISVPIILTQDFDKVSAANGSVLCSAAGFKSGNSCTLLIKGKALADHTIVNTRVSGYRDGHEVAFSDGGVLIEKVEAANLLISHGVRVKADGKESASVTVFNSGNFPATSLQVAKLNTLAVINSDTCSQVEANNACEYKLTATSDVNGNEPFTVSYNEDQKVTTNVGYKAENPQMEITNEINGNLKNTLINDGPNQVTIQLTNKSNRNLQNMKVSLPAAAKGFTLTGNCSDTLTDTCNIKVDYEPKDIIKGATLNLNITGTYKSVDGIVKQYFTTVGIPYSAVMLAHILTITPKNGNADLVATIGQGAEADFTISNTAKKLTANVVQTLLRKVGTPGVVIDGLSLEFSGCSKGSFQLKAQENCGVKVIYAPQPDIVASVKNEITVDYNINGQAVLGRSESFFSEVTSGNRAAIMTEVTAENKPIGMTENGNTYQFTALRNNVLTLRYTFSNKGNQDANKFNVTGIPFEAEVAKDECGITASQVGIIAKSAECSIELKIPTSSFLEQQASFESEALLMANVELPIRYNYTDNAGSKPSEQQINNIRREVSFNRKWATIESIVSHVELVRDPANGDYWLATYKTKVNVDQKMIADGLVGYPLTITPHWQHKPNAVEFKSCDIKNQEIESCEATAKFPLSVFGEHKLKLEMELTNAGMSSDDKLYAPVFTELKNIAMVTLSKPFSTNTQGVVPYGHFKDKVIYASGESYPFEMVFDKSGLNNQVSDIKFHTNSSFPKNFTISLEGTNCIEEEKKCIVAGSLQIKKTSGDWQDIESIVLPVSLSYKQDDRVFYTYPINLSVAGGTIIPVRADIIPTEINKVTIYPLGSAKPDTAYFIPAGNNTGVIAAPGYKLTEGIQRGVNTIKVSAVNDLFPHQVVSLDVFMSRVTGQGSKYFISTYHKHTYSYVEVWINKSQYPNDTKYNYSQTAPWSEEEFEGLNSNLGLGTYRVNFYMYGQESANMDHQYLTYVKLEYTKK
jgi:hypothetical protein